MKYLIVGLGNKGDEYTDTRHNIGFEVVEKLAADKESQWKTKTLGDMSTIKHKGRTLILLKPSTFMNLSGKAVNYWIQKEKIKQANLLVIVDDLNINFGSFRIRGKGSDGGHNGLKDINQTIGQKYARLRIGIGNDFGRGQQINYVLGKWSIEEKKQLPQILQHSADTVLSFASIGLTHTMNEYNKSI